MVVPTISMWYVWPGKNPMSERVKPFLVLTMKDGLPGMVLSRKKPRKPPINMCVDNSTYNIYWVSQKLAETNCSNRRKNTER